MRGRPKLPEGTAKQQTLIVRISADERTLLTTAAKQKDQTVSEFARDLLLGVKTIAKEVKIETPSRASWCAFGGKIKIEIEGALTLDEWKKLALVVETFKPESTNP